MALVHCDCPFQVSVWSVVNQRGQVGADPIREIRLVARALSITPTMQQDVYNRAFVRALCLLALVVLPGEVLAQTGPLIDKAEKQLQNLEYVAGS